MEPKIAEISERIRALRDIMEFTPEEMAEVTGITVKEYLALENGAEDYSFTFLYHCAKKFGVDIVELLTGENPHLSGYSIVRGGSGLPIKRREGFSYYHLAATFKQKMAEPFLVTAPFNIQEQTQPVHLSHHKGQEFNYILSGTLKFFHGSNMEILNPGDSVFYNSSIGHGMIAIGGQPCTFLAIVMRDESEDDSNAQY